MGREVRRVPPNWEHPRYTEEDAAVPHDIGEYRSCRDIDYDTAADEWIEEFDQWRRGEHPDQTWSDDKFFWDHRPPPDRVACRPKFDSEPTWYQIYETVSEGSPVSPPFATEEELARYLSVHGDFWHQKSVAEGCRRGNPPTYEQALSLIRTGFGPSLMVQGGVITNSYGQPT